MLLRLILLTSETGRFRTYALRVRPRNFAVREQQYLDTIKRYSKDEVAIVSNDPYYGTEQGLHGAGDSDAAVREALWGKACVSWLS